MTVPSLVVMRMRQILSVVRLAPFDVSSAEGRSRERYRRISLSILGNFLSTVVRIGGNLAIVPLVLGHVGKEQYGLWMAIITLGTWMTLFDFGISSSLLNAVSAANGRNDQQFARGCVATAFWGLTTAAAVALVALMASYEFFSWSRFFAVGEDIPSRIVVQAVGFALVPLIVQLPLSMTKQIYFGYQKGYMFNVFMIASTLFMVLGVWLAVKLQASLPYLLLIATGVPVLACILALAYLIVRDMPWLSLRPSYCSRHVLKRLFRTSLPLFLMQFGALLVNAVQPLIISHSGDLKTVAEYSIVLRLYQVALEVTMVGTSPFVPSFREAHEAGDHAWMRRSFYRLLALRLTIAVPAGLMIAIGGNFLISLWLGRSAVMYSPLTLASLGALMISVTWTSTFSDLLTIMDRIWALVCFTLLNGAITIAATFVLVPPYGVLGAVLALSCTTVLGLVWLLPIQARAVLRAHPQDYPIAPGSEKAVNA